MLKKQQLRKKPFGQKRKPLKAISNILVKRKESWSSEGPKEKFEYVFKKVLKNKPLLFLEKNFSNKKQKPNIMFLGAGKGNYIPLFKQFLTNKKINPNIDVFSLTKNLSKTAQKDVRKDLSSNLAFEELNTKLLDIDKHKQLSQKQQVTTATTTPKTLQKHMFNNYNLVMAPLSVGYHTKHPANAVFTIAMMLKKGGRAYVEVDDLKTFYNTIKKQIPFSDIKGLGNIQDIKELLYNQKQIDNMPSILSKFVSSYNKTNKTSYRFNIKKHVFIEKDRFYGLPEYSSTFFEIERIA